MKKIEKKNILIHYSEIGLKKGNRGYFETKLKTNILNALKDISGKILKNDYGRFILFLQENTELEKVVERLKDVIGIAYFSIAYSGNPDVDVLSQQVFDALKNETFTSFRIKTRRAYKNFPLTSVEVNKQVGAKIHMDLKKPVDLENPDLTCNIEIFNKQVFFYFDRHEGIRGLPVGSSGRVVSLLSSGIDSPVSSFKMMTRGCRIIFVHFHSFPFTDKASYYNAIKLAKQLTRFQDSVRLYLVPLVKVQEAIIMHAPPKLRLILYRRMMFRIAEIIAKKEKAKALVTGESVGQVASQTLENIIAINEVVTFPVLRPLIGMDKESIIEDAKRIDTFATSIEPYDDCCSYLVPKNPETKAKLQEVRAAEENIENWEQLIFNAVRDSEIKQLNFIDEPTKSDDEDED